MNKKHILPLLFIFPVLVVLVTAQPLMLVSASSDDDDNQPDTTTGGGQGNNAGVAVGEPDPTDTADQTACNPDDEDCGTPYPGPPGPGPGPGPPPGAPSGSNLAESNQVGGIGGGQINQRAQGAVNEQLCSTIGGIGSRQCAQTAPQGSLQDCTAIAGLGKANCVQSENPDGSGTCLTANGRPFICETSTGRSLSGSGQAGQ